MSVPPATWSGSARRTRFTSWFTSAAALLAVVVALAGCVTPAPGVPGPGRHPSAPAHRGMSLAALRAGLSRPAGGPPYYLSLGDSLAVGIQPGATGGSVPTLEGYPDQLVARLRRAVGGLRLAKLGCSGETTQTMIHGGICRYPAGSQLAQATRFLRAHRGRVALVTIDIGGNDPNSCVLHARPATMAGCLAQQVPRTERGLETILARIRSAAGSQVLVVGMTYYVPELALWRDGRTGREIALVTDGFAAVVNNLLVTRYHHYGARVANVFASFRSLDFGPELRGAALRRAVGPGYSGTTPPNVATICSLTWMCARPPGQPNEHPNDAGYRVIAREFWHAITG